MPSLKHPARVCARSAIVLLGVTWVAAFLFYKRNPRLAQPQGDFGPSLGCVRVRLPDVSEAGHDRPGTMVQIVYPAVTSSKQCLESGPYMRVEAINSWADRNGQPRWFVNMALRRRQMDPPILPRASDLADGRWPVVIFSHGLQGTMEMYTQLCRELAAMGAIVIAIEHEDGSAIYARDVKGDPIQFVDDPQHWKATRDEVVRFRRPFLSKRVQELQNLVGFLRGASGEDVEFPGEFFTSPVKDILRVSNTQNIVLAGHSFGAAGIIASVQGAVGQSVCGAVMFDPWLKPVSNRIIRQGLPVPYSIFISEEWAGYQEELGLIRLLDRNRPNSLHAPVIANGTLHAWVSDGFLWLPSAMMRSMGVLGPGDPLDQHRITMHAANLAVSAMLAACGDTVPRNLGGSIVASQPDGLTLLSL